MASFVPLVKGAVWLYMGYKKVKGSNIFLHLSKRFLLFKIVTGLK